MTSEQPSIRLISRGTKYNKIVITKMLFVYYFLSKLSFIFCILANYTYLITDSFRFFGLTINMSNGMFLTYYVVECVIAGIISFLGIKSINNKTDKTKVFLWLILVLNIISSFRNFISDNMFSSGIITNTIRMMIILVVNIIPIILCINAFSNLDSKKEMHLKTNVRGVEGFMVVILIRCGFMILTHIISTYSIIDMFHVPKLMLIGITAELFGVVISTYTFIALIKKRRSFIPLIITSEVYLIYTLVIKVINIVFNCIENGIDVDYFNTINNNLIIITVSALIILYIVKSSRVHNTFVLKEPMKWLTKGVLSEVNDQTEDYIA